MAKVAIALISVGAGLMVGFVLGAIVQYYSCCKLCIERRILDVVGG